jgi:hypothetical protein
MQTPNRPFVWGALGAVLVALRLSGPGPQRAPRCLAFESDEPVWVKTPCAMAWLEKYHCIHASLMADALKMKVWSAIRPVPCALCPVVSPMGFL